MYNIIYIIYIYKGKRLCYPFTYFYIFSILIVSFTFSLVHQCITYLYLYIYAYICKYMFIKVNY